MRLLVLGSGMMGSAAAYDMAVQPEVERVTLADSDKKRLNDAVKRINKLAGGKKVGGVVLDASKEAAVKKLMKQHDGALSCVPYFFNERLCKAAIAAGCHFADLGGNNTVVKKEFDLAKKAKKVGIAPDCGLSPGMASVLAGELMRKVGGKADALKIYVGGLPQWPKAPFNYQLVFSVEGLINEYVEPAKVLRKGKMVTIEPLSEAETFEIEGFPNLEAFHTSGGTSTLPETYQGKVGECFEKTLRYPGHLAFIRGLYDLGLLSSEKRKFGKAEISPRAVTSALMCEKFAGDEPDLVILRVEAHANGRVASYTIFDDYDAKTHMTAMMRTTAWPASIVLQMMVSGQIGKHGGVRSELDVPAEHFIEEMQRRGIEVKFSEQTAGERKIESTLAVASRQ